MKMKAEELFKEIGYSNRGWKRGKNSIFKKLNFPKDKEMIDSDEVVLVLNTLGGTSSKYAKPARELLESITSEDGAKIDTNKVSKKAKKKDAWKPLTKEDVEFTDLFYKMAGEFIFKEIKKEEEIHGELSGEDKAVKENKKLEEIKTRYRILKNAVHMGENIFYRLDIYRFPRTKELAKLCYNILVNEDTI